MMLVQAGNAQGTMMGSLMGSRVPGSQMSGLGSMIQGSALESALDTAGTAGAAGTITMLDAVAGAEAPQVSVQRLERVQH